MKISLVVVGKTHDSPTAELLTEYASRIGHYMDFDIIETSDEKLAKVLSVVDRVILLDERGVEYTSVGFSEMLQKHLNAGVKRVAFVVGGAYGFTPEIRATAYASVSLSQMTFPHQLIRVIFAEQLYRACTILKNEKYHHSN